MSHSFDMKSGSTRPENDYGASERVHGHRTRSITASSIVSGGTGHADSARIMRSHFVTAVRAGVACAVLSLTCAVSIAQAQAETFTAAAAVTGGAAAGAPVTVVVQHYTSDARRKTLIQALEKGATPAARALLAKEPDLGSVQIGDRRTALKYIYARETATGRQITAVTAEPIALAGGAAPAAGFDLGLILLDVDGSGTGRGDLVPATKIRVNEDSAFETEDYNGVVVHLSNVVAKGRK